MVMVKVKEKRRKVVFVSGRTKYFNNVTGFDPDGAWLRIMCDDGYVLLNPDNIDYIIVPKEARVQ